MKHNKSSQFFSIILITLICILFSYILVWPLWKFATSFSKAYTIVLLSGLIMGILYFIIKKIINTPVKKTLKFLINTIIVISGLILSIFLLLTWKRFLALIVILIAVPLIALTEFLFRKLSK